MENLKNTNKEQRQKVTAATNEVFPKKNIKPTAEEPKTTKLPEDLIDDLKKDKIDPLTEGETNLGYDEKPPRKKELDQDEPLE
ncbi:hypothetical protein [Flavobacterium algicola]|uniref:hypothetical protein n=1 Tax=Flavobacterium algicola TaxID=556529 RepID=UPI001EFCEDD5|nr:hypothetical protein [Flavobacterium algicola]MCG9791436.1 hypothetical protein [Flavobacterium algicola]